MFIDFFKSCYNKYDHTVLKKEIENLNMIQHNHSLIIIKNKDISERERFLVYYDERWDCKLFLNYKTQDRNNEEALIDQVCADLQLDKKELSIRYITSRVQEKYSVSHDEYRVYNHRLYELEIHNWQKEYRSCRFCKRDYVVVIEKCGTVRIEIVPFFKPYFKVIGFAFQESLKILESNTGLLEKATNY